MGVILFIEYFLYNQHFSPNWNGGSPVTEYQRVRIKGIFLMKQELINLLCQKSFQYTKTPTFKLASGKMSSFYVNCKPVTLSPRGMYLIGHLVFDAISDITVEGVGGLTFGADPIAMATSFVSEIKKKPFKAFSIRKNQKDHGIIKWIEGDLAAGDRVAIVEDVVTHGRLNDQSD